VVSVGSTHVAILDFRSSEYDENFWSMVLYEVRSRAVAKYLGCETAKLKVVVVG
jgi:hypothetical protein